MGAVDAADEARVVDGDVVFGVHGGRGVGFGVAFFDSGGAGERVVRAGGGGRGGGSGGLGWAGGGGAAFFAPRDHDLGSGEDSGCVAANEGWG